MEIIEGIGGLVMSSMALHSLAQACFAAGTPVETPDGSLLVENVRVGDELLARSEFDPKGEVVPRVVEEVFVRFGALWLLSVGGQDIFTTPEHPFFSEAKGWVPCKELAVGDRLLCRDGSWVSVGAVEDTGRWETVYNFRIAEDHTYFVGCPEWGFGVWAHNAYEAMRARFGSDVLSEATARFAYDRNVGSGNRRNFMRYLREHSSLTLEDRQLAWQLASAPDGPTPHQPHAPPNPRAGASARIPTQTYEAEAAAMRVEAIMRGQVSQDTGSAIQILQRRSSSGQMEYQVSFSGDGARLARVLDMERSGGQTLRQQIESHPSFRVATTEDGLLRIEHPFYNQYGDLVSTAHRNCAEPRGFYQARIDTNPLSAGVAPNHNPVIGSAVLWRGSGDNPYPIAGHPDFMIPCENCYNHAYRFPGGVAGNRSWPTIRQTN